ncbi:MAG TPA: amino acid ABC transporter permease [Candidatus Dormibacteraeota bacterium]|nr:amino acid ABC transporter permease [Candidatus Dormibacteraeota bacterium]
MSLGLETVRQALPLLLHGALVTIEVTAMALVLGTVAGLLGGLARVSPLRPLRLLAGAYVSVIRGTPFIVQLFFVYYAFPQLGLRITPMVAAVGCLAVYSGAYQTEIVRGAIESIERGQMEAARSLGLTSAQAMRYVVLPQAFLRMLPPLGNEFVALTKNSALVSLVTVQELLLTAQLIISATFQNFAVYLTIGIMYYAMTTVVSTGTQLLERRLKVYV